MTDQIIQLQAQIADLEQKIEQLTASRDYAGRCSQAWKKVAKRRHYKAKETFAAFYQINQMLDECNAQVAEMTNMYNAQVIELAQANRCSRLWKRAARRWRQKAVQNTNQGPE